MTIVATLSAAGLLASCGAANHTDDSPASARDAREAPAADATLPELMICEMTDPSDPDSAFEIERGAAKDVASRWVDHRCRKTCDRWQKCVTDAFDRQGEPLISSRGDARRQLAFVVDGMAGHLAFTTGGDKTVLFLYGGGGDRYPQAPARQLEAHSSARTVLLRWSPGHDDFFFPLGWLTRKSPQPADMRQQSRRVATVLEWVHEHLSRGQALGTVADSMGSVATLGAVVWHGLDPIIDYQLLVGGPPMWDVNAGCGRVHYRQGYCDLDGATPCRNDGDCRDQVRGSCRRPAPLPTHSAIWEGIINYLYVSDQCHPLAEGSTDDPHPPFDSSSMRHTGIDWEIDHPVDFMIDLDGEPGPQGRGGDEYWALGQFAFIFNRITPAGHPRSWSVARNSHHSRSMSSDGAVAAIKKGMGL